MRCLAVCDPTAAATVREALPQATVHEGAGAAERLVREVEATDVIAAIVGTAGLAPTLVAVELGRTVHLSNKETLVAAGSLVMRTAAASGATLLPVDSEHSGVFQCLLSLRSGYAGCEQSERPGGGGGPPRRAHRLRRPVPHR